MRFRRIAWELVLLLVLAIPAVGATRQRTVVRSYEAPPHDVFSASEPASIHTLHLELDLEVDFDARRLRGSATHTIRRFAATDRFIVDTRDLDILDVTIDGSPATWTLGEATRAGRPLSIDLEPDSRSVRIEYETTASGDGLHWIEALQTTGDHAPLLFTFGQPDKTREWIPIQDTPGVRMTFDATIRVPPGLLALMSARNPTEPAADGVHRFEMPLPIPPYLIALAVGRFEFHPFDARTGVYAEPEDLEDAAHDLSYLPDMLAAAEEILGPYPFERWDLLLLPPGYAAGGMENPMLNFINVAGVVSGDRESPPVPHTVNAHELAHAWAGDLVTCGTWNDTWLNEGFATYYASRILEAMAGPERGEIGHWFDRTGFQGWVDQNTNDALEVLHRPFKPGDRPSIFTPASYNKGSLFLKMLEDRLGRETFDRFARTYFGRFAFRWVDEKAFLEHLEAFAPEAAALRLDEWIYEPGLPSNVTAPSRSALWDRIGVQAQRFRSGTPASALATSGWTSLDHDLFLWQITDLVRGRIAELDAAFGYSSLADPSIHWLLAVAETLYAPGLPMMERFLRRGSWNVLTVWERLARTPAGRAWALALYETIRPHYFDGIRFYADLTLGYEANTLRDAA